MSLSDEETRDIKKELDDIDNKFDDVQKCTVWSHVKKECDGNHDNENEIDKEFD